MTIGDGTFKAIADMIFPRIDNPLLMTGGGTRDDVEVVLRTTDRIVLKVPNTRRDGKPDRYFQATLEEIT